MAALAAARSHGRRNQTPMDEPENSVVVRVTNAPEPYDGFGTHTIEVLPLVPAQGPPPYRRVAIRSDALDWQTLRYQSGLYPVLDEQTFAEWRSHGLVVAAIQPSTSEPDDSAQRA
jgi:hypothetical protein